MTNWDDKFMGGNCREEEEGRIPGFTNSIIQISKVWVPADRRKIKFYLLTCRCRGKYDHIQFMEKIKVLN